jgi:hypothetical protein
VSSTGSTGSTGARAARAHGQHGLTSNTGSTNSTSSTGATRSPCSTAYVCGAAHTRRHHACWLSSATAMRLVHAGQLSLLQVGAQVSIALLLPAANTDKDSNAADHASSVGDDAAPGSPSNASSAAGDVEGAQLCRHTCCAPCAVASVLLVVLPLSRQCMCSQCMCSQPVSRNLVPHCHCLSCPPATLAVPSTQHAQHSHRPLPAPHRPHL